MSFESEPSPQQVSGINLLYQSIGHLGDLISFFDDLTIFKLHCGKVTLKIYTKGERVLRIEAVLHNSEEL
jgi:hypothetical protein